MHVIMIRDRYNKGVNSLCFIKQQAIAGQERVITTFKEDRNQIS